MTILFDSHIHFQEEVYFKKSKASYFACCGINCDDWFRVKNLADNHQNIIPFYGLHPWFVDKGYDDWHNKLEYLLANSLCGIGETGLDIIKNDNIEEQIKVFIAHLELAEKYQRPVVVHMVKAYEKTLNLLKKYKPKKGFMIHAYSGSKEMIKDFADIGAYFSLGGFFLKKDSNKKHEILKMIPKNKLLIETDSDENITIDEVAKQIAEIMGIGFKEMADLTNKNAFDFFGSIK